jgi:nucleoside-triphosphatase THEP1
MLSGISFHPKDPIDSVFAKLADRLTSDGKSVAGYIQTRREDKNCEAQVYVENLRSHIAMPITKSRGKMATGCKLDSDALTTFSEQLASDVKSGCDVLIIARFGKSEAEGRGLRDVISRALELEIPVIVGVRDEFSAAWQSFHDGFADSLPMDANTVYEWVNNQATVSVAS